MDIKVLNTMIGNYMSGDITHTSKEIIECACEVLVDYPTFANEWEKCYNYINMTDECTMAEIVAKGYELVEELSGVLGEHFAD